MMKNDFWTTFAKRAKALEKVILQHDAAAFSDLTNELVDCLFEFEPRLNLNISGPDPFRLAILPLPGAEELAQSFVDAGTGPDHWKISVGLPSFDPIEIVEVEDEGGELLRMTYADIDAKVLTPKDGRVTILFSVDTEFDPAGPRAHLYQAVAENIVFTVLGGWPPELEKAILLPRNQTGSLHPLSQLRQHWVDVLVSAKNNLSEPDELR